MHFGLLCSYFLSDRCCAKGCGGGGLHCGSKPLGGPVEGSNYHVHSNESNDSLILFWSKLLMITYYKNNNKTWKVHRRLLYQDLNINYDAKEGRRWKKRQLTRAFHPLKITWWLTFLSQLRRLLPARLKRQIIARRLTLLEQENTSMLTGRRLIRWTFSLGGSIHFTPRIKKLGHHLATASSSFPRCKRPPVDNISRAKI